MSKSLLLVLVALVGCRSKPDVSPQTAATARATAGLVQVVPLKYAAAPELAQTLNELSGAQSASTGIVADARTNSLVVQSDNSAEMARTLELIARLDVDATKPASATDGGSLRVVPLRYATAAEVADTLNDLEEAAHRNNPARGDARIVVDARTNSLVVQTDPEHPDDMKRIVELIAKLDVEVSKSN